MTYILAGNAAPIEFIKRSVPDNVEEARAELVQLIDATPNGPENAQEFVDSQDDDQVFERLSEFRVPTALDASATNNETITQVSIPDDLTPMEQVDAFMRSWTSHSQEKPVWIECDNAAVQTLLVASYTDEAGAPLEKMSKGWMTPPKGEAPVPLWMVNAMANMMPAILLPFVVMLLAAFIPSLRTNAGRDFQCLVMGDATQTGVGTGIYRPANYLALTTNATAPAAADTTLTSELSGSGLGRSAATFAHTAASTTYTLVYTWTSSDGTARTINKIGVFNASSTGTLVFTSLVPSPPTLVSGDSLQVTVTVDIT